jgi:hypothetical protein
MFSKLMEKIKNHIINLKLFYMRKNLFSMVLLLTVAMVSFVSCSNDDGGTPKLGPPQLFKVSRLPRIL